jgi:AcrR family transcriptional regulator
MSLREEQRELTRSKILSAVLDLVAQGAMGDLSVPMVSDRSGVSVATIYRYFATKDDLLDAAAQEPALRAAGRPTSEAGDGPAYLRTMWEDFATHVDLVRRQVASSAGREMRARRLESSRRWFEAAVERQGIDPHSEEGTRVVRLALLLTSSVAFLDLHDRQGVAPAEAAEDVTWAIAALTEQTTRTRRAR